jgi:hypothetical protein
LAGEIAPDVSRANNLERSGSYAEALGIYEGLAKGHKGGSKVTPYLNRQIVLLSMEKDFADGKTLDFKPGAEFTGWVAPGGNWTLLADGGLQGTSNGSGMILEADIDVGQRWEITGEFELVSHKCTGVNAGVYWNQASSDYPWLLSAVILQDESKAVVSQGLENVLVSTPNTPWRQRNQFTVRMWDRDVWFIANGRQSPKVAHLQRSSEEDKQRLGIGGNYWYDGTVLRFYNVRFRKLMKSPV